MELVLLLFFSMPHHLIRVITSLSTMSNWWIYLIKRKGVITLIKYYYNFLFYFYNTHHTRNLKFYHIPLFYHTWSYSDADHHNDNKVPYRICKMGSRSTCTSHTDRSQSCLLTLYIFHELYTVDVKCNTMILIFHINCTKWCYIRENYDRLCKCTC